MKCRLADCHACSNSSGYCPNHARQAAVSVRMSAEREKERKSMRELNHMTTAEGAAKLRVSPEVFRRTVKKHGIPPDSREYRHPCWRDLWSPRTLDRIQQEIMAISQAKR